MQWLKVGNQIINMANVNSVERQVLEDGTVQALVGFVGADGLECDVYKGDEAIALLRYLDLVAFDVMADYESCKDGKDEQ